ncbi:inositol monophosphatase [Marinomonas rhizomae]|uniref:Inositol-1-monophosphatase n=1 Tax=Marinomonas rhizomae TaxID=491948 RepID=A0A366JHE4_9GAMM|nr:inositol monophosphatase [Marinomonas rhizomae]RBP85745.1 myo-inositol-1(or 4)-monophosphatase [Marinomonas rhizomae]RNF75633.1 inositol monophosphatase [Marinomonas rhizomae]
MTPNNIKTSELEKREAALHSITLTAGALALESYRARQPGDFTMKGQQDFLTEADTLVEKHIRHAINNRFPEDGLLGEETGGSISSTSLWVVDPIDGTANFARGIDHFCIAIAFVYQGETLLGAIYNPATNEMYLARKGQYVTKNGQALRVSNITDTHSSSFELGWSTRVSQETYLATVSSLLVSGTNIRRGASGALALAWVAEGRTDGYAESHMNAWDCLAGLLMVREAGGRTGVYPNTHQEIAHGGPILAVAPGVAEQFSNDTMILLAAKDNDQKETNNQSATKLELTV